ncbi:MAG: hypothetical protein CM1200mP2_38440 [Planctomycetaceae bacterium]|nr:MAG: hypothetical protein CM1200mP2_38440 [Planctomycetaceae bacterium]
MDQAGSRSTFTFGWRSRGGFGDFNGDGLCDMVTTDGQGPPDHNRYAAHSAIFVQYRTAKGNGG